jgi:hypothetical protein
METGAGAARRKTFLIDSRLLLDNVETDLDITNGACGKTVDIVLHPDEPPISRNAVIRLKYLPSYLLVKLTRTKATKLEGLNDCVLPIEPISTTYRIKMMVGGNGSADSEKETIPTHGSICLHRLSIAGANHYPCDIATPPAGGLSLFHLYVALSRSSGGIQSGY